MFENLFPPLPNTKSYHLKKNKFKIMKNIGDMMKSLIKNIKRKINIISQYSIKQKDLQSSVVDSYHFDTDPDPNPGPEFL